MSYDDDPIISSGSSRGRRDPPRGGMFVVAFFVAFFGVGLAAQTAYPVPILIATAVLMLMCWKRHRTLKRLYGWR